MEKYSAYRDPGTGIQPFLRPLPATSSSDGLAKAMAPFAYILGAVRTVLVLLILGLYLVVVEGVCTLLKPLGHVHHKITSILTSILTRLALLVLGFVNIHITKASRKKGRNQTIGTWQPNPGDVIVSNWVSWIEVLWLAFRFNPTFTLPVPESLPQMPQSRGDPVTRTPGRRTGTGSANISQPSSGPSTKIPIAGFRRVSLLELLRSTGSTPAVGPAESLDVICKASRGPVVVFPECTTSNGRGLLRFSDVFKMDVPVISFQVFVMAVRYDPPTAFLQSMTHSLPANILNPLGHVFAIASSLSIPACSIHLLSPTDLPSSPTFLVSELFTELPSDPLSETCAILIAQIGRLKRTGMGWEDKYNLMRLVQNKKT
ncbi:hypothetical protein CYLTODRAFT_365138 [Cylindrobasidium torrendii FP15055 ss-10]|uniref:Phospholipid/glycerol acyltransferase domain-containing protein n=1 Tax=Cylindrobasidium torrendii FP15055 ss-10 TaxID=1314674 RepID=A0A0D7BTA5_9AGAR|nr:hypothetical protein CYLTODRAFT_365138 [Cylindrobasidium torrendii FP15055 ss-10]